MINSWQTTYDADVKWLTAWRKLAKEKLAPKLNLNDFDLAEGFENEEISKFDVIKNYVKTDIPIIWIDVNMSIYYKKWREEVSTRKNTLFIEPYCGLTRSQVQEVNDFLILGKKTDAIDFKYSTDRKKDDIYIIVP